jgi:hypothetical protein
MRISDFIPEASNRDANLIQANTLLNKVYQDGFGAFFKSHGNQSGGFESQSRVFGIEQLYMDWLRTAFAYRRQFLQDLYLLAYDSTEIRTPLLHLKNQVFKKGFDEWKPKFKYKCVNEKCGKEYKERIEECKECGGTEFREPDSEQLNHFEDFRVKCNIFNQSLEDVMKVTLDDINIADDAFILLNKKYKISDNSKKYAKVEEIRRIHPALMELDLDKNGLPKNSHYVCVFHRDNVQVKPGFCGVTSCKEKLAPVMYIYNHRGRRIYLPEDEVIHFSKFSPSESYGYSMLLTIMQKVLTLSGMDRFLYRYFFERKAPTGMIMTSTDDPQSLELERTKVEAKMMEDPTYIPWVAVSQKSGRGRTDFIRLFNTLQEMDYLPVRNEIRDRIAAAYGVPQMYMNVMDGVGGISGETQQLKVFNDVIQADQRIYNEKVFPVLLDAFGITDWEIGLRPPEEKVEGQILQLAQQKVVIAQQMLQMGFDVELKPEHEDILTLDFSFTGKAVNQVKEQEQMMQEQQQQQGAMGGMGGVPGLPMGQGGIPPDYNTPGEPQQKPAGEVPGPAWQRNGRNEDNAFQEKNLTGKNEDSDFEEQVFKDTP